MLEVIGNDLNIFKGAMSGLTNTLRRLGEISHAVRIVNGFSSIIVTLCNLIV